MLISLEMHNAKSLVDGNPGWIKCIRNVLLLLPLLLLLLLLLYACVQILLPSSDPGAGAGEETGLPVRA